MNKTLAFILLGVIGFIPNLQGQQFSDTKIGIKTVNYKLKLDIDYENEKLIGDCQITILNTTGDLIQKIPILLYRLMKVKSIRDEEGITIPFIQQVLSYEDWEELQVNFIEILLERPVAKGVKKKIHY